MFEYDICLCGNGDDCPNKDTCKRYSKDYGPGIYTMAAFYNPDKEECEDYLFWEEKKWCGSSSKDA